ncbi:hypothetical protein HQ393_06255 [Chitinibacter bivalviorum]|uniref:Tetratricopeptide repeat protein n=1 Tax=Chitinibacter bivalviorum TaxID=2739434 RepID=A0A7H9BGP4_9NEIS|nr:hypothetical protein [Chitinibacter bivalviorum]QLG87893.1 hypothetical protein HQ393_06255 [Chitinibacter bivalviorum]
MMNDINRHIGKQMCVAIVVAALVGCVSPAKQPIPPLRIDVQSTHSKALQAIHRNDLDNAQLLWRQTLQLYQALDDWNGQGMARLGLAQTERRLGDVNAAKEVLLPMQNEPLFGATAQAQALFQLAQLSLPDTHQAKDYLNQSVAICPTECSLIWAQKNLNARIAAVEQNWGLVQQLAQSVIASAPESEAAERAHAYRLSAQSLLAQNQAVAAQTQLEQGLLLDRQLARPDWLLEDYRLLLLIAQQQQNAALISSTEKRIASLCAAMACK